MFQSLCPSSVAITNAFAKFRISCTVCYEQKRPPSSWRPNNFATASLTDARERLFSATTRAGISRARPPLDLSAVNNGTTVWFNGVIRGRASLCVADPRFLRRALRTATPSSTSISSRRSPRVIGRIKFNNPPTALTEPNRFLVRVLVIG